MHVLYYILVLVSFSTYKRDVEREGVCDNKINMYPACNSEFDLVVLVVARSK